MVWFGRFGLVGLVWLVWLVWFGTFGWFSLVGWVFKVRLGLVILVGFGRLVGVS